MKTLKQIQVEAHALAREKGFYDDCSDPTDPTWIAARLALVHAEVSEALECVRNEDMEAYQWYDKPEGFGIELADVVLRLADLAESLGIDLDQMVELKMSYNKTRPNRHGGKKL